MTAFCGGLPGNLAAGNVSYQSISVAARPGGAQYCLEKAGNLGMSVKSGDTVYSPEDIVSALYQSLLRRTPQEHGLLHYVARLRQGVPLAAVFTDFVNSAEFSEQQNISFRSLEGLPANKIDLDLSDLERNLLWTHVGRVWSQLGISEPYWSVLSQDEFRMANMSRQKQIDTFYQSGHSDVERIVKYLVRHGREFPKDGVCVDYGCGLGRVTLWLARQCGKVVGVDISETHLNMARENLAERGAENVEFYCVRGRQDLRILKNIDFFHSMICLQHSPPPVIEDILRAVFAGLNPGGCAFFQLFTFGRNYSWEFASYMSQLEHIGNSDRFEMHMLPQSVVFRLAAEAGCIPLEVQPDGRGVPSWLSNTFLIEKPPRS